MSPELQEGSLPLSHQGSPVRALRSPQNMIGAPHGFQGSPAFLAPKLCPYGMGLWLECHLVAISEQNGLLAETKC